MPINYLNWKLAELRAHRILISFSELLELRQARPGDLRWLRDRPVLRLLLPASRLGGRPPYDVQQSAAARTPKIGVAQPAEDRRRESLRERQRGRRRAGAVRGLQGEVTSRRQEQPAIDQIDRLRVALIALISSPPPQKTPLCKNRTE